MGEMAYIGEKRELGVEFIQSEPGTVAAISFKRIAYFWCGAPDDPRVHPSNVVVRTTFLFMMTLLGLWGCLRAIRKKVPGAWLLLATLVFYPLFFYIMFTHLRCRHPLALLLFLESYHI